MSTDGPLRVGRRECGIRLALSLAKSPRGKVSPGLSYPYPDPQQGTLRTRVRVQNRLIGQFGAPQARQNVPAPSMRRCGLGVYSTQCCTHYSTVHWLGEGPVVQHEGVLKTPRTLRSRARLPRCAHQRKGRKHNARGAERLRGGCGERGGAVCTLWLLLLDGGFTLCVSAAVTTTGWIHAQHVRRSGE